MKHPLRLFGIFVLCAMLALPATAQELATPVSDSLMSGPGFPGLSIRATEEDMEAPSNLQSGRFLVRFENASGRLLHPLLVRLPDDISVERAVGDFTGGTNGPPSWLLDARFPGFVGETMPGETSRAVVDLVAGRYVIVGTTAVSFEVMGSSSIPPAQQTPPVDVRVEAFEYDFVLPEDIGPGRQVWSVTNSGTVPHELILVWTPDAMTPEEMLDALFGGEGASDRGTTPVPVGGLGWLSPGRTAWTELELPPGSYLVLCFVYDPVRGSTHLEREMIDSFTIEGDAKATPIN